MLHFGQIKIALAIHYGHWSMGGLIVKCTLQGYFGDCISNACIRRQQVTDSQSNGKMTTTSAIKY